MEEEHKTTNPIVRKYQKSAEFYQGKHSEILDAWKRYYQLPGSAPFPGRSHTVSVLTRRSVEIMYPRLRAIFMSGGKIQIGAEFKGDQANLNLEELIEGYMDQKMNVDIDCYEDIAMFIKQGIIAGTSVLMKYWANKRVNIDYIDIFNVYPEPRCKSMRHIKEGKNWMVIREVTTLEKIRENQEKGVYNPKVKDLNLSDLKGSTEGLVNNNSDTLLSDRGYPTDMVDNDKMFGKIAGEDKDGYIEVLHYWKGKHVTTVTGNGNVELRDEDVKSFMYYGWKFYPSPFDFHGEGVGELLRFIQEEATLIRNQRRDMETLNISSQYSVIEGADIDYYMLSHPRPGGYVRVGDHDDIRPLPTPGHQVIRSSFTDEDVAKTDADSILSISDFQTGSKSGGSLTTTASGIEDILRETSVKINESIDDLSKVLSDVCQDVLADYRKRETTRQVIRIVGREGVKWEELDVKAIEGEFNVTVKMDLDLSNKELKAARSIQLLNTLAPFRDVVDVRPIVFEVLKMNEFPNPEQALLDQGPTAPVPPELENMLLQTGILPDVHPEDNHEQHVQVHNQLGEVADAHVSEHMDAISEGKIHKTVQTPQPQMQSNVGDVMSAQAGAMGGGF